MRYQDLLETVATLRSTVTDNLPRALPLSFLFLLVLLYVRGMVRAYRAAGTGWNRMDRDVRVVFLLAVPLFRGGIRLFLWADRLYYTPKVELIKKGPLRKYNPELVPKPEPPKQPPPSPTENVVPFKR